LLFRTILKTQNGVISIGECSLSRLSLCHFQAKPSDLSLSTKKRQALLALFSLNLLPLFLSHKQATLSFHRNTARTLPRGSVHETTKILLLTPLATKSHLVPLLTDTVSTSLALLSRILGTDTSRSLNLGHGQEK